MRPDFQPSISVVIAVYNGENTIKKAIDSIIEQSWPVNEIIVVDDGSTDNTRHIISEYKGKVIYVQQPNSGVSIARNKGVELASSEWICFLDADDWYYPERIKLHIDMIQKDPTLDFLTGNFDYINEKGKLLRQSMQSTKIGNMLLEQAQGMNSIIMEDDFIGDFVEQHFGDTHTLTVRRSDFLKLGGYPKGVSVCEDVNFLIRLCAISKKIGVVTQPIAAYYIHSQSATRSNPLRAQLQTLEALQSLKHFIKSTNETLLNGLVRAIRHARLDLAYTLLKLNRKGEALKVVLPLIYEMPGFKSVKDVLSVGKG